MRFEVLGPLRVTAGSATIAITARREQVVLAMLLLQVGERVDVERLVEAVWGEAPPRNAVSQIHGSVYRLRKRLVEAAVRDAIIVTESGGYRIEVDLPDVDLLEFHRLRKQARAAVANGECDSAASLYRAALNLWRGPALAGVKSVEIRRSVATLEEERAQTLQECVEAELGLGKAGELVPELTGLVQRHPYREGLHAALMRALYSAGRQADALAAYRHARQLLHDELGTEPGAELQHVHQAILNRDPALDVPRKTSSSCAAIGTPSIPRELPADVVGFTGRDDALASLDQILPDRAATGTPRSVVISAIAGMAGVGKTALAVHAAHRMAERYPDGQLFIDLHGFTTGTTPVEPADALDRLLRSLGVPGQRIPVELDDRTGLWRSILAERNMLIVLDNAAAEGQVAPLLPGAAGCLVLVTSRRRLAGLDTTHTMSLDTLPLKDALTLFSRTVGEERLADDSREQIAETVELCGRLPLAIRIAGARLRSHPTWRVGDLVERLRVQDQRLAELEAGTRSVNASLELSYRQLTADQQHLYRLLGLHPGPDINPYAAAALADSVQMQAVQLLDQLFDAHLLQELAPRRFAFHDLVRAHSVNTAIRDEAEPRAALGRLLDHYRYTASVAMDTAHPYEREHRPAVPPAPTPTPDLPDPTQATAWLDTELPNLLATARLAAGDGWPEHTWHLSAILQRHLRTRSRYRDAKNLHRQALATARTTGDRASELAALNGLGHVHRQQGQYEQALDHYEQALHIACATSNRTSELEALNGLGRIHLRQGRHEPALDHYQQALDIARATSNRTGELEALIGLGHIHLLQGRHEPALDHYEQTLSIARATSNRTAEIGALTSLGNIHRRQGRHGPALDHYEQALDIARATSNRTGELDALNSLGRIHLLQGRHEQAAGHYQQALDIAREIGNRNWLFEALHGLGRLHHATGHLEAALTHHHHALELATDLRQPDDQARAHDGIAHAYHALHQHKRTRQHWQKALDILTSLGTDHTDDEEASASTIRAHLANLDQQPENSAGPV